MQKKIADKDLVVITVSLDPPDDKQMVRDANAFLRKAELPFRHLLLNESEDFWSKKFEFNFPPCYYVFDRQGKWVRYRASEYKKGIPYDELEKVVRQMLGDK
jgi:hypothetical protein